MSKKNELPEFIISPEKLKENHDKALLRDKEAYEDQEHARYEKKAFIVVLFVLTILATITICQMFIIKETRETSTGTIKCSGKIVEICVSSNNTKNYAK